MKFNLVAFFLMVFFAIGINYFLFYWWRKGRVLKNYGGNKLGFFLFGILPVGYVSGFLFFWYVLPGADSAEIYRYFSLYTLIFLLLFIPKFIFSVIVVGDKIVRLSFQKKEPADKVRHYPRLSRRKFLSQVGIIMATAPFVTMLFGAFKGRYAFYTKHVRLSFPNLPAGFDGFRLVQISDLHLGSFGTNKEPIIEAFEIISAESPDMILFTGDMVNNFAGEMQGWEDVFSKLKAPMGKYSILGNHDYGNYSRWTNKKDKELNFKGVIDGHEKLGFTLLRNQGVKLEREGDVIGLGGVENWGRASFPCTGDLDLASAEIKDTPFRLLMSHDPDHWDTKVLEHNLYDLTLSGHTHGMQFGIEKGDFRWSPAQYIQKRWAGLFREGDKYLYVNRGLGYLGMPARVGMPPEITVFELSRGPVGAEPM